MLDKNGADVNGHFVGPLSTFMPPESVPPGALFYVQLTGMPVVDLPTRAQRSAIPWLDIARTLAI